MKDILFGMAIGGVLGILLYKNNSCTKEMFDTGETIVKKEIEKLEKLNQQQTESKQQSRSSQSKKSN